MLEITPVTVLHGHVSPETAYVVEDYPYGYSLRCQIRYWVETATKGAKKGSQRFMAQTTNPKRGDIWNTPKGSTYSLMVLMVRDEIGHIHQWGVSELGISPEGNARFKLCGIYEQLTESDRRLYDVFVKRSQKYAEPWEKFEATITAMVEYMTTTGEDPVFDGSRFTAPGSRGYYVPDDYQAVYLATARQRLPE